MPAALLDVDGTLVDATYHHALAWFRAFREHDITLAIRRIHRAVGMGSDQLVPSLVGAEIESEKGDEIRETRDGIYEDLIEEVAAFEGARELIEDLLERDVAVVLASSAPQDEIDHYLELLDVRTLVDAWTTKHDVDETKPEPDLVKAALGKAGEDQAVFVGDSRWDVEAASRCGLETVCVLSGGAWSEEELRAEGAVGVFESVRELREGLDETPLARP